MPDAKERLRESLIGSYDDEMLAILRTGIDNMTEAEAEELLRLKEKADRDLPLLIEKIRQAGL